MIQVLVHQFNISSYVIILNLLFLFICFIDKIDDFTFSFSVCLRLQVNPQNKSQFHGISPERGFADFIFAHIILHIVIMNFIG